MAVVLAEKIWRRRTTREQWLIWAAWLLGAALFIYCFSLISEKTIWVFVTDAPAQAADLAVRMVPPDWGYILELGRPMLRATNTGISSAIGHDGHVISALPWFTRGVLEVSIAGRRGETPYLRFGDVPVLFITCAVLAFALARRIHQR